MNDTVERLEKFIDFSKNDSISKMSKKDLTYFLFFLNQYDLEYRKSLGLQKKHTFGIEIEAEYIGDAFHDQIIPFLLKGWIQKNEYTLEDGDEYASPILSDNEESWHNIKKICEILDKHYEIKDTCGGHIHIGANILGNTTENWIHFLKIWSVYENIIYRFSYGEYLTPRLYLSNNSKLVANYLWYGLNSDKLNSSNLNDILSSFKLCKRDPLNLNNVKGMQREKNNTIEIRCPNGTLNPIIWQNNINFFMKLLLYCKNKQYNEDILLQIKSKNSDIYKLKNYRKIYLEQAIELADLIFTNNLDKVYFLRQYLKSFQISYSEKLERAKQFTK